MNRGECPERSQLVDEYCRAVTDFNIRMEALRLRTGEAGHDDLSAAEEARARSQTAWDAVSAHIGSHKCMPMAWTGFSGGVLEAAAMHALDVILVVDDQRRFVDVNEAAVQALGRPRDQIIGRCIDDFFSVASGEFVPAAWEAFVAEGVQAGLCELISPAHRRFQYRAKANFARGFHLSVLREVE